MAPLVSLLVSIALASSSTGTGPYDSGRAAYARGEFEAAADLFLQAVRLAPRSAEAHTFLGLAHLQLGRAGDAAVSLAAAARLPASDARVRAYLAVGLGRVGESDARLQALEDAVRLAPNDGMVAHELGLALARSGATDRALPHLARAAELLPDEAESQYDYALALHRSERLVEAIPAYRRAIARDPKLRSAFANLGALYLAVGRPAAAREAFGRALALDGGAAETRFNLALACEALGDREGARREAERARADGNQSAALHYLLGVIYRDAAALDRAESEWRTAIERDRDHLAARRALATLRLAEGDPEGVLALLFGREREMASDAELALVAGRARQSLGDKTGAETAYRAAAAVEPDNAAAIYALAQLVSADPEREAEAGDLLGRFQSLERHAQQREETTQRAALLHRDGRKLLGESDASAAAAVLTQALALDPGADEVRNDLARALLLAGDPAGAQREAEAVLAAAPADPYAHVTMSLVSLRTDRVAALRYLEQAVALDPLDADTRNLFATILLESEQPAQAAAILAESVALDAANPETRRLLGTLTSAPQEIGDPAR